MKMNKLRYNEKYTKVQSGLNSAQKSITSFHSMLCKLLVYEQPTITSEPLNYTQSRPTKKTIERIQTTNQSFENADCSYSNNYEENQNNQLFQINPSTKQNSCEQHKATASTKLYGIVKSAATIIQKTQNNQKLPIRQWPLQIHSILHSVYSTLACLLTLPCCVV